MTSLNQMPGSYDEFLLQNRKYINGSFLYVIFTCIFTGPAIALGIYFGVFNHTNYYACFIISFVMLMLYLLCWYLYKISPYSRYSAYIAICVMNIMLVYMSYEKINVRVTWFLMPLLSMLLLDIKIYVSSCLFNYLMVILSIWLSAPFMSSITNDVTPRQYFLNEAIARSIESFIMAVVGYEIGRLISFYYKSLIEEKHTVSVAERMMEKQIVLLESMSELYDRVNYIDFESMIEQSLQCGQKIEYKLDLENNNHSHMVNGMIDEVPKEDHDRFLRFTDLKTIQSRLSKQKIISEDFKKNNKNWYRLQYIVVASDENGYPTKVIFTTLNIDEEKRKEKFLLEMALTDELTKLSNRRCYDRDVAEWKMVAPPENLCIISVDVNGLKIVNDTLGHMAGDELINGAVDCILKGMKRNGKLYRTGGDEFVAIIFTTDYKEIGEAILNYANQWRGIYNNKLAISIGMASVVEYPYVTYEELEKIADDIMYQNKAEYYKQNGIDRNALYNKYQAR
ncbi:diguanylate cyclase (GGDEF) domain-containing protein [Pseudobutyrivibrio sp. ACV-2]|uniref:GGDEF domain-containing protein n=1 Tax=Pseudobutyrivibrio sp. ACV-2 TaxID=1520801 RepID=UPI00089D90C6|nr:GGDEF domain-containing protein [Pseudobutyrivibrio sp. ACV-2]SEA46502.1 diguanylate cyclase (GGDEF) domain-containing protein [Pseudobutyrivibrio sp. ACV-2]